MKSSGYETGLFLRGVGGNARRGGFKVGKAWGVLMGGLAGLFLCWGCTDRLGGAFSGAPEELQGRLSPAARLLVERAFSDLGGAPVVDYHAHVVGMGSGNLAEVNEDLLSWWHPLKRGKACIYLSACGITNRATASEDYVARLVRLVRGFGYPVKVHILAMDHFYDPDGRINRERTEFYVANEYVVGLAERYPDLFIPVVSVHPYRPDAIAELEKWAQRGVRQVKWLPNAQGMDPSDPRNDDFYRVMSQYGMVLLSHTGEEKAVDARDAQRLGNPLLLRRPLDLGVRVILAHCASLGSNPDLDHPGRVVSNVELFFRMMNEEKYRGLLVADISATTQANRTPYPLLDLIERPELQGRLVNGSDYPLPAINCVIWTRKLVRLGLISAEERSGLNEIYEYNPLLFDFVLKRTIRHPVTQQRLAGSVFVENALLGGGGDGGPVRDGASVVTGRVAVVSSGRAGF